ncbi:hypothetical protein [Streptomyces sp. NBC_01643]|uniref:hypothetical protein n=1 Tax=Streptomyces sp. NBC_01643 TaxID=2975906 RepID=UPI002F90FA56|nr:hypothetical protein OHB03_48740 [Streptomyces sp. NBC_01643]
MSQFRHCRGRACHGATGNRRVTSAVAECWPRGDAVFTIVLAIGSVAGAVFGGLLLGAIPDIVFIPGLALILLISAFKTARHAAPAKTTA